MARIIDDSLNSLQAIDPEHILDLSEIGEEEIDTFSEAIREVITGNHDELDHRDYPDQHPISAITGLQEALDNSGKQVYRGADQPTDENILIWIDTSAPVQHNAMLTSDGKWFMTSDNKEFVVSDGIALLTSDNKEFYEATHKQFITKGEI